MRWIEQAFEDKFDERAEGLGYRPSPSSKVYLANSEEKAKLHKYWRFSNGWRGMMLVFAVILLGAVVLTAVKLFLMDISHETFDTATAALVLVALGILLWPRVVPWLTIRGRKPIAGRLDNQGMLSAQAGEMPWFGLIWLLVIFAVPAFFFLPAALDGSWASALILAFFALGWFGIARLALAKWHRRLK